MGIQLTFDLLPVAAVLISLLAWYVPKFKDWYAGLRDDQKQFFMIGALVVIDIVVVALSALGFLQVYTETTWQGWVWKPLVDIVMAILANAGFYKATNKIFKEHS